MKYLLILFLSAAFSWWSNVSPRSNEKLLSTWVIENLKKETSIVSIYQYQEQRPVFLQSAEGVPISKNLILTSATLLKDTIFNYLQGQSIRIFVQNERNQSELIEASLIYFDLFNNLVLLKTKKLMKNYFEMDQFEFGIPNDGDQLTLVKMNLNDSKPLFATKGSYLGFNRDGLRWNHKMSSQVNWAHYGHLVLNSKGKIIGIYQGIGTENSVHYFTPATSFRFLFDANIQNSPTDAKSNLFQIQRQIENFQENFTSSILQPTQSFPISLGHWSSADLTSSFFCQNSNSDQVNCNMNNPLYLNKNIPVSLIQFQLNLISGNSIEKEKKRLQSYFDQWQSYFESEKKHNCIQNQILNKNKNTLIIHVCSKNMPYFSNIQQSVFQIISKNSKNEILSLSGFFSGFDLKNTKLLIHHFGDQIRGVP